MNSSIEDTTQASLEQKHPIVEEVEDVVCTRSVLVRFPCFDFFRNVHLCEGKVSKDNGDNDGGSNMSNSYKTTVGRVNGSKGNDNGKAKYNDHNDDDAIREENNRRNASSTHLEFRPDSVEFVPGTLYNEHPILVINAGTPNEMVFIGNWSEVINEGSNTLTNRAIVQLVEEEEDSVCTSSTTTYGSKSDNKDEFANLSPNKLVESKMRDSKHTKRTSDSESKDVASLFTHHPGGVTADEERATKRRRLTEQKCRIGSVDVPSAILVMHRYK